MSKDLFNVDVQPELTRPEEQFGDYSTNVALQLAGKLKKNPREVAIAIASKLHGQSGITEINIAGPGFINLKLTDEALMAKSMALRSYVHRKPRLQRGAAKFLCVSDFVRQKLLARGFPPEKTEVHYIGVDTTFFQAEATVQRSKLVLFVGRLVENKGCDFLLRAMGAVQVTQPDAELVVIGDGHLQARLENQAAELHLRNYRFLGMQPPAVVREWLNRARVFCVPSVEIASGASEGFGLVFAEAQSMGVPVVSFKTGGIPEAVADGHTGLLAPPRDWQLLAKYIDILLTSPGVWENFSTAGRDRIRQLFNLKDQSETLEEIYRRTIQGPHAQSAAMMEYANA